MKINDGILIAFEGIDGSGKSSHIKYLFKRLTREKVNATVISYSDQDWFREAFENQPNYSDPSREIEFFAWAFNKLVERCVCPLLLARKVVLIDRYLLSFFAYQSFHEANLEALNSKITCDPPTPDLTIILDVPVEVALNRCIERDSVVENSHRLPFELTAITRLKYVDAFYKRHAGARTLIVEAHLPFGEVAEKIWRAVNQLLNL